MLAGASAQAQVYDGNDTGGIISWSCENEAMAPQIAAAYCARWDKYPRITSVHRQYGDYIAFNCLWSPYAAPLRAAGGADADHVRGRARADAPLVEVTTA